MRCSGAARAAVCRLVLKFLKRRLQRARFVDFFSTNFTRQQMIVQSEHLRRWRRAPGVAFELFI